MYKLIRLCQTWFLCYNSMDPAHFSWHLLCDTLFTPAGLRICSFCGKLQPELSEMAGWGRSTKSWKQLRAAGIFQLSNNCLESSTQNVLHYSPVPVQNLFRGESQEKGSLLSIAEGKIQLPLMSMQTWCEYQVARTAYINFAPAKH